MNYVRSSRMVRQLLVLMVLLLPCQAGAHGNDGSAQKTEEESTGITEQLGAKIPLDVTFRDETGKPVTLAGLITGPTVILPVFYRCPNVCSVLQIRMAAALQKLELSPVADYRVISVSFDEEETPAMAARSKQTYLSLIKKPFPPEGWRFLTGDRAAIHRLFDSTIIRYLYGVTVLPKDLALAITEARSGVAGASIRKVMDFCFSYDPVGKTYVFNLLRVSATVVILAAGGFLGFLILTGKKRRQSSGEKP